MTGAQPPSESLAAKTVKGSIYSIGASAVTLVLGLGRSILMARLLAPEDFGMVAFALTFLNFATPLRDFGLDQALIHRKTDEERSLDEALAVHFSLRLILIGLFVLLLLVAMPVLHYFYPQKVLLVPVLLALTVGEVVRALGATPTTYLQREMCFAELALLQVLTSLTMTIVGPWMAWQGWGVWAIVAERVSGVMMSTLTVWVFIRPWQPYLKFDRVQIKSYLDYGKFVFATRSIGKILEEFDDFWIGTSLGSLALGYYSKSYEIALYPRRIISDPLTKVVFPLFAKLQEDRLQLSKAYFRFSGLVTRISFLVGGVLVLIARPFVQVFLGTKWLPMVTTFQLMIVYVLLDPLLMIGVNLAQAVGHPDFWTHTRVVQIIFFIPAVILSSRIWGIRGVALATDIAMLIGLGLLFFQNQRLVDISFQRLVGGPILALLLGISISWHLVTIFVIKNILLTSVTRAFLFALTYLAILSLLEHKRYAVHINEIWKLMRGSG